MTYTLHLEDGTTPLHLEDGTTILEGEDWGGAYIQATKDAASSTAAPTNVTWPDTASKKMYLAGDWGFAFIESANETAFTVPTGWTLVDSIGVGTAGGASATFLGIYAKQAVSAAEATQDWGDAGDHTLGFIIVCRNLDAGSSPPWELLGKDAPGGIGNVAVTIPGGTTLGNNRFVFQVVSTSFDNPNGITQIVGEPPHSFNPFCVTKAVNASLANFRKWWEQHTGAGNGGGIIVLGGEKAVAGTVDAATFTMRNSGVQARICFALIGTPTSTTFPLSLSSSITIVGVVQLTTQKPLSSSVGLTGTLAKLILKPLTSSITAAGSLINKVLKTLTGTSTPAGTLQKTVKKPLSSTSTPTGTLAKRVLVSLLSSIGLSGTIAKVVKQPKTSTVPLTGPVQKTVQLQAKTSSITPAGTLLAQRVALLALASSVTAAAVLARMVLKPLASSVGLIGTLTRVGSLFRTFTSSVGLTGSVQKTVLQTRSSSVGLSGTLAKRVLWSRSSTVLPAGTVAKVVMKPFASSTPLTGAISRQVQHFRSSSVALAGALQKRVQKSLVSSVGLSGVLAQVRTKFFAGNSTITPAGTLQKTSKRSFASSIGLSGLFDVVPFRITISRRFFVYALNRVRQLLAPRAHVVTATLEERAVRPAPRRLIPAVLRIRTIYPDEDSMAQLPEFSPKRSAEADNFTVDFLNQLNVGETLSGPTVAIAVSSETLVADAGPSLAVSGGAVISGTKVVQKLVAGLTGALYVVTFRVGTSTGRTLEQAVRLYVKDETA